MQLSVMDGMFPTNKNFPVAGDNFLCLIYKLGCFIQKYFLIVNILVILKPVLIWLIQQMLPFPTYVSVFVAFSR